MNTITEAKEERLNDLNNLLRAMKETEEYNDMNIKKKALFGEPFDMTYIKRILENQKVIMQVLYNVAAKIEKM